MVKVGLFNSHFAVGKWPLHIPLIDEFDHQENGKDKEKTP